MDASKVYFDSEGNECSIWQVVKREPTWAAVRIQEGEKAIDEIAALRQQLADVTGCACNSEGPCKYHAMTSVSGRSYVLRKQAEKLEEVARLVKEGNEAGLSTVASIYEGLLLNATSLRNEAERAGGEE